MKKPLAFPSIIDWNMARLKPMLTSDGSPRLTFDAEVDMSSMYGVQWMASHPTYMGLDCAVKLAELALTADRVFVPMANVRAPDLTDDQTIPQVLQLTLPRFSGQFVSWTIMPQRPLWCTAVRRRLD